MVRERLYRSRDDRILLGVAGGMAEWLDLDPSIVRLVWALLVVAGGAGAILYLIAAIVIPEEPVGDAGASVPPPAGSAAPSPDAAPAGASAAAGTTPPAPGTTPTPGRNAWAEDRAARRAARRAHHGSGTGGLILGMILILVGGWFLVRNFLPDIDDRFLAPGLIVVVGILLIAASIRRPAPPAA